MLADPEGNEFCVERSDVEHTSWVDQLGRAFAAVGDLISKVRPEQWSAPTPCTEWTVGQLVDHLIGMNRVFAALLAGEPPPRRAADDIEGDPAGAYRDSAARLRSAFEQPGVLERTYRGPLGAATGAERLQIRQPSGVPVSPYGRLRRGPGLPWLSPRSVGLGRSCGVVPTWRAHPMSRTR